MANAHETSPATCQVCGKRITGKIVRHSDKPRSAFCSDECRISTVEIEVVELELHPLTEPFKPRPVYAGETTAQLHYDRFCECEELYENQITVPKSHSVICFCPKCGCVTQD